MKQTLIFSLYPFITPLYLLAKTLPMKNKQQKLNAQTLIFLFISLSPLFIS
jgi:hypothetical protein